MTKKRQARKNNIDIRIKYDYYICCYKNYQIG